MSSRFLFLLPPNEPFTPERGSALATCELGLGRGLRALGHDVVTVAPESADPPYAGERLHTYRSADTATSITRLRLRASRKLLKDPNREVSRGVRDAIRTDGCARVVVSCNSVLGFESVRARCAGVKTVLWLQNVCTRDQVAGLEQFGPPDLIAANSAYTATASAPLLGWPDIEIHPLLNAVDIDVFTPRPDFLESDLRRPMEVLLLGRIDPNKGFDRALSALKRARDAGVAIRVTLAGPPVSWSGDPHAYLARLQEQLGEIEGEYIGHVDRDRLPALIRAYDVMLVLSISDEPFGLVVLEAMASGLAVISSNRGGLPEACGTAGMLVDPDSLDDVTAAIVALADPRARCEEKARSVERAAARTWDHAAGDLLELVT